jgi:archaellum component FlaG (FlaF/FlaG flagellin family)
MSDTTNPKVPEQFEQAKNSSPADRASEKLRDDFRNSAQGLPAKPTENGKERPPHPELPQITIGDITRTDRQIPNSPKDTNGNSHRSDIDLAGDKNNLKRILSSIPLERSLTGGIPYNIEGQFKTNTGDVLEIKDGKQTLTTADGKNFVVGKDGSISGDAVTSIKASKDGKEREVTLSDGTSIKLDQEGIARIEHPISAAEKSGSYTLTTGDKVTNTGDKQVLTTPSGTKLTVNKDGSFEVDGKIASASADGKTIQLGDGSVVHLENGKIAGLERKGVSARVCGDIPTEQWNHGPRNFLQNWHRNEPRSYPEQQQVPPREIKK